MLLLIVILSNGTVSEKFRLMLLMLFYLKSIKDVARELFLIYTIQVEKIVCAVEKDNICTIIKRNEEKKMKRSISDFSRIWQ